MADTKITALTELTEAAGEDLLAIVDDPSGTPITKKISKTNLLQALTNTAKSKVYLGSDQSVGSTDVITKVSLNTEVYDPGSNFDNATNYVFTAPVTGYYLVTGKIRFGSLADQNRLEAQVYINGSLSKVFQANASGTADMDMMFCDIFYVTATQTIGLWGRNRDANTVFKYVSATYATFMTVHLLSL